MHTVYTVDCALYNFNDLQVEKFAVQRPLKERGEV